MKVAVYCIVAVFFSVALFAEVLIEPIPETIDVHPAKVKLGKKLFSDPILSKKDDISCATCHILQSGGDDNMKFSFGEGGKKGSINSPTVHNSVFNFRQFWNGRAKDLKEQAKGPIENPVEMANTLENAAKKLKGDATYSAMFEKIYPDGVTVGNMLDAIAEYEKALITPNAPFDKYLNGEKKAISDEAERGYGLLVSKGCILCHHGVNVGGNLYNKFGIFHESNSSDLGRYDITGRVEDKYVFKVPSLRNVELTEPYMHDGSVKTLRDAVLVMTQYQLGREMTAQEIDDIVAFLRSLTAPIPPLAK